MTPKLKCMSWCYVVIWCVENFGAYPDWSNCAEVFQCQGKKLDLWKHN